MESMAFIQAPGIPEVIKTNELPKRTAQKPKFWNRRISQESEFPEAMARNGRAPISKRAGLLGGGVCKSKSMSIKYAHSKPKDAPSPEKPMSDSPLKLQEESNITVQMKISMNWKKETPTGTISRSSFHADYKSKKEDMSENIALHLVLKIKRHVILDNLSGFLLRDLEVISPSSLTHHLDLCEIIESFIFEEENPDFQASLLIILRRFYIFYIKKTNDYSILSRLRDIADGFKKASNSRLLAETLMLTDFMDKIGSHHVMLFIDQMYLSNPKLFNEYIDLSFHTNWTTIYSILYYVQHMLNYNPSVLVYLNNLESILKKFMKFDDFEEHWRISELAVSILRNMKTAQGRYLTRKTIKNPVKRDLRLFSIGIMPVDWAEAKEETINELHKFMNQESIIVLCGNIGKSTLAGQYALTYRDNYDIIFKVDCNEIEHSFLEFSNCLKIPYIQDPIVRTAYLTSILKEYSCLFIYDNVRSHSDLDKLIKIGHRMILSSAKNWPNLFVYGLERPVHDEFNKIFYRLTKVSEYASDLFNNKMVSMMLGGYFVNQFSISELKDRMRRDNSIIYNGVISLQNILKIILDIIKESHSESYELLGIITCFYHENISRSLYFQALREYFSGKDFSEGKIIEIRYILEKFGLIQINSRGSIYITYKLMSKLQQEIPSNRNRLEAITRAFLFLLKKDVNSVARDIEQVEIYVQVFKFLQLNQLSIPEFYDLFLDFSCFQQSLFGKQEVKFTKGILEMIKKSEREDKKWIKLSRLVDKEKANSILDKIVAQSPLITMEIYMKRAENNNEDSEELYEKAIEIATSSLGAPHPMITMVKKSRGKSKYSTKKYTESLEIFLEVLNEEEIWYEEMDEHISETCLFIAEAHKKIGNWTEAIDYYEKSMVIKGYDVACYRGITKCLYSLQDYSQAIERIENILLIFQNFPLDIVKSLRLCSMIYISTNDYEKAEEMCQKALKFNCEDENELSKLYYWLGKCYYGQENYKESLSFYQKSLELYSKITRGYSDITISIKIKIARNYQCLKDFGNALDFYIQALDATEKSRADEYQKIVKMSMKIGDLCLEIKERDKGIYYYNKAMSFQNKDPKYLQSNLFEIKNFVYLLEKVVPFDASMNKELLSFQEKLSYNEFYGEDLPEFFYLAGKYLDLLNYNDYAVEFFEYSQQLNEEIHGENNCFNAFILNFLGILWLNKQILQKSESCFNKCLRILEALDHSEDAATINCNLGILHYWDKRQENALSSFTKAVELIDGLFGQSNKLMYDLIDCISIVNETEDTDERKDLPISIKQLNK